jgi:DNA mismatch repair protein MutS
MAQRVREDIDGSPNAFASILFEGEARTLPVVHPECVRDLHLDQLFDPLIASEPDHDLRAFFFTPLGVRYRQDVFRDLEDEAVREAVERFAKDMATVRRRLRSASKGRYRYERERWLLDAVHAYAGAVSTLADDLGDLELRSRGLGAFRRHLQIYAASASFRSLVEEATAVQEGLDAIRYIVRIKANRVMVADFADEPDLGEDVVSTFAKFRQGAVKDYTSKITQGQYLDHVEAGILDIVARKFPEAFEALERFCRRSEAFRDEIIWRFDREIHFYLTYVRMIRPLIRAGLTFCFPEVSGTSKDAAVSDACDLVLARMLMPEGREVVRNGFSLRGPERLLVVSGPNQGGKTTFARMVGQLHHLAQIGCPVPATEARCRLPDRIFTHFEREEDITTLRGKLEDELVRLRPILDEATGDSLIIMNESFASTTLGDARFLGTQVIERLRRIGVLGVYVTFVEELASLGPHTVSMVSLVDPEDPAVRTFRVVRRAADGRAYAEALAEKHGLSVSALQRRLLA